ncbi:MAG: hypothetical protein ABFS86_00625 [Planctomycetota bacterium]
MAKRNQYSYSKRQRELKKKKKQEEKRLKKHGAPPAQMVDPLTGQLVDIPVEGEETEGTGEEE